MGSRGIAPLRRPRWERTEHRRASSRRQWGRSRRRTGDRYSGRAATGTAPCRRCARWTLRDRICLVTGSTGIAAASPAVGGRGSGRLRRVADRRPRRGARGRRRAGGRDAPRDRPPNLERRTARPTPPSQRRDRAVRTDRRAVLGRRRQRPAVRRRTDPRGERRRLGPDARAQPATQALVCRAVVRQMLAQQPNGSGTRGSILLMSSVIATIRCRSFRDARVRGGEGRDRRAR